MTFKAKSIDQVSGKLKARQQTYRRFEQAEKVFAGPKP